MTRENRVKYPRTPHLPFSLGATSDDRMLVTTQQFHRKRVVVTEKMDGENTTLYRDGFHARSLDSGRHESRDWLGAFWASIGHEIPEGWRVCGENVYARHSIAYDSLPSYFLGFSIWDETNTALDWDSTLDWFTLLGITPVPTLFRGIYDEGTLRGLWDYLQKRGDLFGKTAEGYVVRLESRIPYGEFGNSMAKFVRENHVQSEQHWRHLAVVPNKLSD